MGNPGYFKTATAMLLCILLSGCADLSGTLPAATLPVTQANQNSAFASAIVISPEPSMPSVTPVASMSITAATISPKQSTWPAYTEPPIVERAWDYFGLPIPAPPARRFYVFELGDICCEGVVEEQYRTYLALLQKTGYELLPHDPMNAQYQYLVRDNDLIRIKNHSYVEDTDTATPYIGIRFFSGYHGSEAGRVDIATASRMIQRLQKRQPTAQRHNIKRVIELELDGLFEHTGLQSFCAFDSTGVALTYLAQNNGDTVHEAVIFPAMENQGYIFADLNEDGAEEYICLSVWGSGMITIQIAGYQVGKTGPEQVFHGGYSFQGTFLTMIKTADGAAHLCPAEYQQGELIPTGDFGPLRVEGDLLIADGFSYK